MANNQSVKEAGYAKKSGYVPVNGLHLYYEIEGSGKPLVYIPMGLANWSR